MRDRARSVTSASRISRDINAQFQKLETRVKLDVRFKLRLEILLQVGKHTAFHLFLILSPRSTSTSYRATSPRESPAPAWFPSGPFQILVALRSSNLVLDF